MNITENLQRIKQGKESIITALQNKGSDIKNDTLINEISNYVEKLEIGGGGGDTPSVPTELVPKYDGATVFRIAVPEDNYEFAINLCNDATKATYDVDWGDGSLESGLTTDEQHHTYSKKGIYDVNIYNLSKDITLGGGKNINEPNDNTVYVSFLFNNTNDDSWRGGYYLCNKNNYVTNILIGKAVTSIGSYALKDCSSLQSVVVSEGVTSINLQSFNNCSSLQNIELPSTLTSIDSYTFQNCSSLQNIELPSTLTSLTTSTFENCSSLQSIVLPEAITSIGNYVFKGCSSLQNVCLPNNLIKLESGCFEGCKSLNSINIPESVTNIGNSVFAKTNLKSLIIPKNVSSLNGIANSYASLENITVLSENITLLINSCFGGTDRLQAITFTTLNPPTSVMSNVLPLSYKNKYTKRYIYVPKDSTGYNEGEWLSMINSSKFELRYIEDRVKTPTTLKLKTKNNFFHNLQAIGQANLIDYKLVNDEYIYNFDDKIIELIQHTFYNNVLEEIELPEGLEIIGNYGFQSCSSLQSIVIPDSVTTIGNYTFNNCSNLHTITCKAMTAPTIQSNTFSSVGSKVPSGTPKVLRVPEGADYSTWLSKLSGFTVEYVPLSEL